MGRFAAFILVKMIVNLMFKKKKYLFIIKFGTVQAKQAILSSWALDN